MEQVPQADLGHYFKAKYRAGVFCTAGLKILAAQFVQAYGSVKSTIE